VYFQKNPQKIPRFWIICEKLSPFHPHGKRSTERNDVPNLIIFVLSALALIWWWLSNTVKAN
jgi:hypothetical protein